MMTYAMILRETFCDLFVAKIIKMLESGRVAIVAMIVSIFLLKPIYR